MNEYMLDALVDSLKMLPFLFITYLILEWFNKNSGSKTVNSIQKAGKLGPVFGGVLGMIPQCGVSAAASSFYVSRVVGLGTLISVYLSTSDEMLPILISETVDPKLIVLIMLSKMAIGIVTGFIIEFAMCLLRRNKAFVEENVGNEPSAVNPLDNIDPDEPLFEVTLDESGDVKMMSLNELRQMEGFDESMIMWGSCGEFGCNCGAGQTNSIFINAILRSLRIFCYIFIISFILNYFIGRLGEDVLKDFVLSVPVLSVFFAALIGLIPNCAASVVITELYTSGVLSLGAMMAGLLVGAGAGILVLLNAGIKLSHKVKIISLLYAVGCVWGLLINFIL